jgi:ceramide glucosyltransferase
MAAVLTSVSLLAGFLALCGCGYYVLCIYSARAFLRTNNDSPEDAAGQPFTPGVSILKPLRGADREMYESFRSHCLQDYPEYEIIFGVNKADDPAIALVERLKHEFPERRMELVFCAQTLGTNMKVSNLVQMLPHTHFDYLIVNDSDIRVSRHYLRQVVSPMIHPRVGLVTALYRGAPGQTLNSKLEALGIETDFAAGVLSARVVERGIRFGLGSTLAFKRAALDAVGGFAPLLDYLGDDYELGKRIADAGYDVVLSCAVVDTFVPDHDIASYWNHQLRWMRTVRASRGGGYAGLLFTFGLPFAIAALIFSRAAEWSFVLLGLAVALRFVMAWQVAITVMRDRPILRHFWLIPLRDVVAVLVWVAGFLGNKVLWRGNEFRLIKGKLELCGKLKIESSSEEQSSRLPQG